MGYIGSKKALLEFIHNTITEITGYKDGDNYVFADLFAGTGIVGASYREKGCTVISNDLQYYSYVINKYLIESNCNISKNLITALNSLPEKDGFIYKNFCKNSNCERNYFKPENGKKCDAIRIEIENLYKKNEISETEYFCLLASLLHSIDKFANTTGVYGAYLKFLKEPAKKDFELSVLPAIKGPVGKVYNENANDLIRKIHGDVLYLDPPYNDRQYCLNYHILETIAKYDEPELYGITGRRNIDGQKSKYCSKRTVEKEFEDLVKNANFKYIFLSYNDEGLLSLEKIKEIMSKHGEYKCYSTPYRRYKADKETNRNIKRNETYEYLHCLIKKEE